MRLPGVGETKQAQERGAGIGPDRMLQRAALIVRCNDCDGAVIVAVAYVDGRPLAGAPEQGDRLARERTPPRRWHYGWADRSTIVHARIGAQRHEIWTDELAAQLPRRGTAKKATWRVSHEQVQPITL
jgi:hypothetical protein